MVGFTRFRPFVHQHFQTSSLKPLNQRKCPPLSTFSTLIFYFFGILVAIATNQKEHWAEKASA